MSEETRGYLLVVDDIPDILNLLDTTLTFKGYRVVTARNGQEALEAIQKERPALVIADILMPKMDGFSLVHHLRIDPVTRDLPVVFLSATYVTPEDKDFALAIGVTQFIEKPVDIETFLPAISNILSQKVKPAHQSVSDFEFYDGYRKRLETKLHHKTRRSPARSICLQPLNRRRRGTPSPNPPAGARAGSGPTDKRRDKDHSTAHATESLSLTGGFEFP